MAGARFTCSLTKVDEPVCTTYARVTVVDGVGDIARACPRHAVAALNGISGARIDWDDSKGLNEFEIMALKITEERSKLNAYIE
jgi:hypothetical protein